MMIIEIKVKGKVIHAIKVVQAEQFDSDPEGLRKYLVDGKHEVCHYRKDGALVLAQHVLSKLTGKPY